MLCNRVVIVALAALVPPTIAQAQSEPETDAPAPEPAPPDAADPVEPPPAPPAATPSASQPDTAPAPPAPAPGAEAQPTGEEGPVDITEISLEELLQVEIDAGEASGFGSRLHAQRRQGGDVFLHGFAITEFTKFEGEPATAELEYLNLIAGAKVGDHVVFEAQLETRENGREVEMKYGQIDVKVAPEIILRFGKFLAPIGTFNEYLYPEYLNKMVFPPFTHQAIMPRGLTAVGGQVRGKHELSKGNNFNYALFIANNPIEEEEEPTMGDEEEEIASFISGTNEMDSLTRKAFGGRLGARLLDRIDAGVSGYVGTYEVEDKSKLFVFDADLSYKHEGLALRGEFLWAHKEDDVEDESVGGFFVQAAYKLWHDRIEPAVQYDQVWGFDTEGLDRKSITAGINTYPFEDALLVFKLHGEMAFVDDETLSSLQMQLGLGF